MRKKITYSLVSAVAVSAAVGLAILRVQDFALKHSRLLEFGVVLLALVTVFSFYMANDDQLTDEKHRLNRSAQTNADIVGSTITASIINNASTSHFYQRSSNGKGKLLTAAIMLILIAAAVYFYSRRNVEKDCSSSVNGDSIANGSGNQATSGNCNSLQELH